ncbi:inositol monophosphatase family protein [Spirillospora sp. NPDC047279]|uniref:inositol monophosphatase family protein n=1 Tax=Spirillospora sp. NPDC047279 TaxID=3155478 RepID=UPI0033CEC72C
MDLDDLALARMLADHADEITMSRFQRSDLAVHAKPDRSLVTEADTAAEAELRRLIAAHRPGDAVLGEEEGGETSAAGQRWILDPLDHTGNFVRGVPVWATLIALEQDGEITVGVVSAPAMGRRWWAARGRGAHTASGDGAPRRITVSEIDDLAEAHVTYASLDRWERRGLVGAITGIVRTARFDWGSGGFWGHMLVAEGRMDASLDPWGEVWDLAAPKVIVEEAGGRLTDLSGEARIDRDCAIVTNARLHAQILTRLAT